MISARLAARATGFANLGQRTLLHRTATTSAAAASASSGQQSSHSQQRSLWRQWATATGVLAALGLSGELDSRDGTIHRT